MRLQDAAEKLGMTRCPGCKGMLRDGRGVIDAGPMPEDPEHICPDSYGVHEAYVTLKYAVSVIVNVRDNLKKAPVERTSETGGKSWRMSESSAYALRAYAELDGVVL